MLLVSLDQYFVVVALPEIARDLGYSAQAPLRNKRVYVKRDGRWQVVLFQQTRTAAGK